MVTRTLSLTCLLFAIHLSAVEAVTLRAWDFTSGPAEWRDEAGSQPSVTTAGALWVGSAEGVSLRSPALEIPTQAFQVIEISALAERPGQAHVLWQGETFTRVSAGWQGGLPLNIPADGQPHEVRLLPLWQNLRAVTALRIVSPPGLRLRLRSLRIVGPDALPADALSWRFAEAAQAGQWLPLSGLALLRQQQAGLQVQLADRSALVTSPPLQVPTFRAEWLAATITAAAGINLRVQWATTAQRGLNGPALTLRPGTHTYNIHAGADRSWNGLLSGLAIELAGDPGAEIVLHELKLANEPQGPADLRSVYAGPVEARPVLRRPFRLSWVLQNDGGQEARGVKVTIQAPAGISVPPGIHVIDRLDHGVPEVLTWLVRANEPGTVRLQAEVGEQVLSAEVALSPAPPADTPAASRVPPPVQTGRQALLAHLHVPPPAIPGPAALDRLLYHRPYLGDYPLEPEVVDWQIKWALEHGLTGFILDVTAGNIESLDSFFAARLSPRMSACLRWTAEPPSLEEGRQLFGADLAPLLAQPGLLRWQDKPVVLVARALQRTRDGWGLADLRPLAQEANLSLVACLPLPMATPELLEKAGYAAAVDLHMEDLVNTGQPLVQSWEEASAQKLPHVLSLQPACQQQLPPDRLQTLLRIALLRAQRQDSAALPFVIMGDWNGPVGCEPRGPDGPRLLETVRQVVGLPEVPLVLPEDVGLGPYERCYPPMSRVWEFDTKESWTSAMGLSVLRIANGQLTGRTDSAEPALFGGDTLLDTRQFQTIAIGLAASAGTQGRLYWRTSLRKFSRDNSLPFDLIADGAVHEYRLSVGSHPGWRGYLESLRLDPTDVAGAAVALDYVRVLP